MHLEGPMLRLTWTTFGLALVGVCLLVARTAAADLLASLLTRWKPQPFRFSSVIAGGGRWRRSAADAL